MTDFSLHFLTVVQCDFSPIVIIKQIDRDGVFKTCDEVDGNIKSMYQLMAKVEELNKGMGPAYRMGEQLKEIKRLLDIYEAAAAGTSIAVTSQVVKTTSLPPSGK